MLSFHIGVFDPKNIHSASPYPGDKVFLKGFQKNGFDTVEYDYRSSIDCNFDLQHVQLPVDPDIIWMGKCERINEETMISLKKRYPNAIFCKWAADVRTEPTEHDLMHCKYVNLFVGTFGGNYLERHKVHSDMLALSMLAFTDSDFYRHIEGGKDFTSDVLWTGHRSSGDNSLRNDVINTLSVDMIRSDIKRSTRVIGLYEWIGYPDYNAYISGTKIGIGCNSFKRVKYSSDRLGNYMSTGAFFLTEKIEGLDSCFKDGIHLDSFSTIAEMEEKIDYYLKNDDIRKQIAKAGQAFVNTFFDSKPLVENILYVIKNKKTKYEWDELY